MGQLLEQARSVPGRATNEYQLVSNLMYLMNVVVGKIKSNDPDLQSFDAYQALEEAITDGAQLIILLGEAPALLNNWNSTMANLATVGILGPVNTRIVSSNSDGERTGTSVSLQVPICSVENVVATQNVPYQSAPAISLPLETTPPQNPQENSGALIIVAALLLGGLK